MKTTTLTAFLFLAFAFLFSPKNSFAHCQVPCGIYEDSLRIDLIYEHITTIEKAMNEITDLSRASDKNYNQIVRWVNNKEIHATKIQTIASEYFLHQRIKPVEEGDHHHGTYLKSLEYMHQLSFYAMKAKQSTDLLHVARMRKIVQAFANHYFKGHKH